MNRKDFSNSGLGVLGLFLFNSFRLDTPVRTHRLSQSQTGQASRHGLLVKEHCFQCHSNETHWTWYSNIAPGSWLIAFDVIEGRQKFNFSDWNKNPGELDEMVAAHSGRRNAADSILDCPSQRHE